VTPRPFRVLGVQQVALGGPDKAVLRRLWVDLLGLVPVGRYRSEAENVDEDILVVGSGDARVEIDLMQPVDPGAKPRIDQPALHHVGLWVDDLPAAKKWLSEQGVRFSGDVRTGASGHRIAFIHPKGSGDAPQGGEGVLIELVQAPDDLVARSGAKRG
jgi:lactoylglutathione lyase